MGILKNILLCVLIFGSTHIFSQDESIYQKTREVSLNMSGMISQFAPFTGNQLLTGPFDVTWLSGRNNTFFRMSLGGNIGGQEGGPFNSDFGHLALGVGFTKRRKVYKNWIYESSVMGMGYAGGLNSPNANDPDGGGLGLAIGFAPGYEISDRVRINAEAMLFLGLGTNVVQIIFVPPIAVNLKYRFITGQMREIP